MIPGKLRRKFYHYLPAIKIFIRVLIACLLVYLFVCCLFLPSLRFLTSLFKKPISLLSSLGTQANLRNTNRRTNVLILGSGGANHTASDLTDSLIFASINLDTNETVLLSIPRDIWAESLKAKINTAYHYGEEKKKGGGLILAKATVSEVLDQPVHYGFLLDFQGFVKAIDLVGGIGIEVERTFDDYKYPIPGKEDAEPEELRYEHLHFDQGLQHMDGERALKFVRSRYAEGEEGTDFARSKRQQKMLLALKNKLFSVKTILNPKKIKELIKIFGDSIDTDIDEKDYPEFLKLALKLDQSKIKTAVLDENLLYNPPNDKYDGQWVLVPKSGSWQEIQDYVQSLITIL